MKEVPVKAENPILLTGFLILVNAVVIRKVEQAVEKVLNGLMSSAFEVFTDVDARILKNTC